MSKMLEERFSPAEAKERAYRYFIDYEGSMLLHQLDSDPAHMMRLEQRVIEQLNQPVQVTF